MEKIQVSIIIKALNEEVNIAKCIESCIKEAEPYKSEVILVDSLSSDKTVDIAKDFSIKIVQFINEEDVSCGSAPQLGYQHSLGDYIYIIDGDMEFCEGFLSKAIDYLDEHTDVAGIGGKLVDTQIFSDEDKRRADQYNKLPDYTAVTHLGGGGLYRRFAIESVNYISHRGLKAFEEAELGLRLMSQGWKLIRVNKEAALHTGHYESSSQRLKRQWKNGRLAAHGTFIKSSLGKKWCIPCVKQLWFVFAPIAINTLLLSFLLLLSFYIDFSLIVSVLFIVIAWIVIASLLSIKRRSATAGFISVITWHFALAAAMSSLRYKIKNPSDKIESKKIA